ncbi:MAG TPA: hypothetical protein VHM28_01370 [Anaerolineales bacterium]|nr:hypothetical protein [Anaerolineales bacterium]
MTTSDHSKQPVSLFVQLTLWFGVLATIVSLGLFAYLGTFTRYLSDDYCDTMRVTDGSILGSLIDRYVTISDRYSNLLLAGLNEFLLPRSIQITPVFLILFWTMAFIWLIHEIRLSLSFDWSLLTDIFLGMSFAFFPILEAPNRFQTIYWRISAFTHFAPLIYLIALAALLLLLIRRNEGRQPKPWLGLFFLVAAFFGGGFSEPPAMILIVASFLALLADWFWEKGPRRAGALSLLAWTFIGGVLALLVMKFSPANSIRLGTPPPDPVTLVYRTLWYSIQFILDSIKTLPLPTFVSISIPLLLFYILFINMPVFSSMQKRNVLLVLVVIPVLAYILIAASFAPSVYGQAYPIERARFAGRLVMTMALMFEGACLGVLFAQWKFRQKPIFGWIALLLLVISSLYSLRATWNVLQKDLPIYRQWASAWDDRQKQILALKASGERDIVVPQLPGIEHVKELDTSPEFWVNRCAADFYGVHSISAPQYEP